MGLTLVQDGRTPLHLAAMSLQDEAIKVLVMEGQAKLDTKDKVVFVEVFWFLKDNSVEVGKRPLEHTTFGSSTHALLTEMEYTGADEHVLTKSAAKRFKPLKLDE